MGKRSSFPVAVETGRAVAPAVRYLLAAGVSILGISVGIGIGNVTADDIASGSATQATLCTTRDGKALPGPLMLASNEHAQHQGGVGEHALHRQMMQRQGYTRSAHDYRVPGLELRDSDGDAVNLTSVLETDRPVMLNFIYTTCTTICPVLSATFSQVQRDLGHEAGEVSMISISIDPDRDTPQQLRKYAQRFDAGPQWRFVTGQRDRIVEVQKAFDIYRGAKTNHEPVTLLRAAGGSSWIRIEGIASAGEIIDEYRALASLD